MTARNSRFVLLSAVLLVASPLLAVTRNWTGTTSGVWSVASNWGGTAPLAGDDLAFSVPNFANALTNDYPAGTLFAGLSFSNGPTTYSLSGNAINLGGAGITQIGSAKVNDFVPITLTFGQGWTSTAPGFIGLNGPATLNLGANQLTFFGSGADFVASTINGTGNVFIDGSVDLTLSGTLNYTGTTTVQSGANLNLTSIGTINTPIVVNGGGKLTITPGFAPLTNATVTLNSGSTYEVTINGAGSNQVSRLTSNAGVNIAGNLHVTANTVLPPGTVVTILSAQGGSFLTGTFNSLPEGTTYNAPQSYTIHYGAQDVTLTALAQPSIAKAFGAPTVALGGTTTLTFTITNPNASQSMSGVAFTDVMPPGIAIANPNGLTGGCGIGTINATTASGTVTLSGGTIAANSNCTFSINVIGGTVGPQNNTTSNVTSTEGGTGGPASASITVLSPPVLMKAFGAPSITTGSTTTLTFTLNNANTANALTNVSFTDPLPAGMTVATPNGASTTCTGATLTAVAGSSSIALSGATINASSNCTAVVSVTSNTPGAASNTTNPVTSANGGTGNFASASLTVGPAPGAIPALSPLMMLLLAAAMALIALLVIRR